MANPLPQSETDRNLIRFVNPGSPDQVTWVHSGVRLRTAVPVCWVIVLLMCSGWRSIGERVLEKSEGVVAIQREEYVVEAWHADEGLPQGTVTAITQGRDGYLWLGTFNGLVRFDGVRFRVFGPRELGGIGNGRVVQLWASQKGGIWVAFEDGELMYGEGGHFQKYSCSSAHGGRHLVREMCEDASGALWMRTYAANLVRLADGQYSDLPSSTLPQGVMVQSIASDRDGTLWVAAGNQLFTWDPVLSHFRQVEADFSAGEILAVTRASDSGVWVVSSQGSQWGMSRVESRGQTQYMGSFAAPSRALFCALEDSQHRVWLGTLGDGLIRFGPGNNVEKISAAQGLPNPFVRSFHEDGEGNMWVGMQGGGLARLRRAVFQPVRKQEGLSADQVLSVAQGSDGDLWVGTNGEGLNRVNGRSVEHWTETKGLDHGSVWSVLKDRAGTLWAGTYGGGLYRFNGARFGRVGMAVAGGVGVDVPIGSVVLALFEDRQGDIWLGQPLPGRVTRLVNGEPMTVTVPAEISANPLDVRAFAEDPQGGIWIGTHGAGLLHYHHGAFKQFTKTNGLGSDFVWALKADATGRIWIGTYQGGLSCYAHGHFSNVSQEDGLPSGVVCQIVEDDQGFIWLGTYGGVVRISKWELEQHHQFGSRPLHMKVFTKADGLPSIECTGGFQPSACRLADGRLCFPTVKGLALVNPRGISTNTVPPGVRIEEVWIDGALAHDGVVIKEGVEMERGVENGGSREAVLNAGWRRLEIKFTGLSFSSPEQLRFQARMVGWDRGWRDLEARRSIEYLQLPPGEYQFEVMARSGDHIWSPVAATFPIRVLPSVYQTKWFQWGLGLVLLMGLVLGIRALERRRQSLRIEMVERQRMVEVERLRIAQDIHDDLGARLTEITLLSELATDDAQRDPNLQGDLRQISNKARELTRSVDEIVWAVNPSNDTLESLVTYVCSHAESFLRPASIRCLFDLPSSIPRLELRSDVRHQVFLAFKEALTNVIRHSGATEVSVGVEVRGNHVEMSIQDNGRGLGENSSRVGGGNGVKNMKKRLERLGGECVLVNGEGGGVRIEFHFVTHSGDLPPLENRAG